MTLVEGARVDDSPAPGTRGLLAAVVVGASVTVAVLTLPFVRLAYRAPGLHLVLETFEASIGALVALLLFGRFVQERRSEDLLLVAALGVLSATNLALSAVPSALARADVAVWPWAALAARGLGAVMLLVAALAPPRVRLQPTRTAVAQVCAAVVIVLGAAVLAAQLVSPALPPVRELQPPAELSVRPRLDHHPAVAGLQLVAAAAYAGAAFGFVRRGRADRDAFLAGIGAACVLAAFARVHYLLFPSLYSSYVYTGDLLRLAFYLVLLVVAVAEIRRYWAGVADVAVTQERRRIARELHEGLAQDLSLIYAESRNLVRGTANADAAEKIARAAERALDESHRAVVLARPVEHERSQPAG